MRFIKDFKEVSKSDASIAGGKGSSLGEMTQAGIPVPSGFLILSDAFERFLEETDLNVEIDAILHKVKHEKIHTVENASEEIKALILEAKMPRDIASDIKKHFSKLGAKFVAVRSSATAEDSSTAAWAGQLESYLNTTEKNLLENVKRCWASLFTPRAIFYRFEKGLHKQKISVAVVVQKMIQSEVSGVAFSVHPVTQDRNQIIIEAGFGLGEAIVSGQITPDSYVVEKKGWKILDKNISNQQRAIVHTTYGNTWQELGARGSRQKLSDKEIIDLAKLIAKIEKHYGFPVDVEWARTGRKFCILQSRPITTLKDSAADKPKRERTTKPLYTKLFTRDNGLLVFQLWYESESKNLQKWIGWTPSSYILNAIEGVTEVYYNPADLETIKTLIIEKLKDETFLPTLLKYYKRVLTPLKEAWVENKPLPGIDAIVRFFDQGAEVWSGLAITYFIPTLPKGGATKSQIKVALEARKQTDRFFEDTDRIFEKTLKGLFPKLGELSRFIQIEELRSGKISSPKELEERNRHFIFYKGKIFTRVSLKDFVRKQNINLEKVPLPKWNEFTGEVAMKGKVKGKVKVVIKKKDIPSLRQGEILVTTMTTPDYVSAMERAAAFITDEGGITSHAAIVAREMNKPAIIGTKIATQVLKDGDLVEVDANKGMVKILKR